MADNPNKEAPDAVKWKMRRLKTIREGREAVTKNLKATKASKLAFDKDPKLLMADFLRRKGFKVNSIRVVRKKNIKAAAAGQHIDVGVARHAHSGPSASGWV